MHSFVKPAQPFVRPRQSFVRPERNNVTFETTKDAVHLRMNGP
ncbi:MAG: hypothetical protein H6Q31_844 [Bacteroidetes bacterium]|nr:hypothetical protein [Bacteroidota bacterium]